MPDIVLLPLDLLDPHPHNPRRDVGDITELAESIRAQGVRQNLLVVPQPHGNGHVLLQDFGVGWRCVSCSVPVRYTIVIGHRRAAAAQAAGLVKVPAAVDNTLDEQTQRSLMLVENLQRADLTPVEEAEAYQGLLDLGVKVREIVKRVGRSEKTVTRRLRLMKLPDQVREAVHTGQATLEDAAALQAFSDGTHKADKKILDKLAAAIGTPNFSWEMQNAKNTLSKRAQKAELTARAEAAGLTVGTHQAADAAGLVKACRIWEAKDLTPDLVQERGATVAVIETFGAIALYRPPTDDDRAYNQQRQADKDKRDAYDAQLREEAQTAWNLRHDFVLSVLTRKRLPREHVDAIITTVAPFAISDSLGDHHAVVTALGLDPRYRTDDQLAAEVAEMFPDAHPAAVLLLALHSAVGAGHWTYTSERALMVALYQLLEQLGYNISDVERARVFSHVEADA